MVAAIAAPIAGLFGGGVFATTAVNLALYAGVSAASILLQMSMATEQKQEIGTKLDAVIGGAVNQSFHFGEKESAGSFIYKGSWGISNRVPNAFLVRVFCLGDRPVDGFKDYIWAAGRKCNYDAGETQIVDGVNLGHPINAFNSSGGHRLWVKFHDGSQTSADNYLVEKFGDHPKWPWTEDHVGRGRPYMIITQKYDKKQPEGEIEVLAVLKHAKFYDWRADSTNGGSGSQRYGNYGTYGVDPGNPVVMAQNVMRGIEYSNAWLFGGQGWPKTRFDNDTWTAAANKCDTNVSLKGGGNQKWARAGGEIDVSDDPWTVVERLLKTCNGRLVESGGVFKIYVGGIGASVWSFTDGDIIVSEELTGRLFPTREEIANTVNGTYIEPANAGEAKAFKPRTNADFVAQDGDVRKTAVDYDYVRDNIQAQRMAVHALREGRRFRTFVLAFWTPARKLEPCDVVSWTSDRYQFEDKKFIVGDVILRADGIVIVNLREADNADSNWELSDEDAFETGVFDEVEPPPQTLTATVTSVPFTDDAGKNRRPAVRIVAALDDEYVDCRALRYQVRKRFGDQKLIYRGRSEAFFEPDNDDYGDITFTSASLAAFKNKQVQVRYKIEPESDRDTSWSDWADHTITLGDYGIDDDDTSDDLLAAPTGLSITKVQEKDEDGTIRTFLELDCNPPGWAGAKASFVYEVDVTGRPKPFRVPSGDTAARFRVNRTNRLHTVRVKARNGVGQNSSWTASISITPSKKSSDASAVTGIAINRKNGDNVITWDRISDPDNREVAVMAGTANVLASMTEIGRTKSTKWVDTRNIAKGTRIYYRILPVDTSDNVGSAVPSAAVDDVEAGIGTSDTDRTTLAAPTGISLTQANRDVDKDGTVDIALLTTFSGGVAGATGYEVEWVDSAGQTASARADTGKFWFKANTIRSYQARWRAYDWTNQPGNWSSYSGSVTPAAVTGAPAAPSGTFFLGLTQNGVGISGGNTPSEFDYAFSEVSTNASTVIGNVIMKGGGPFVNGVAVFLNVSTTASIYMRHVNTSGLRSSWTLIGTISNGNKIECSETVIGASASGSIYTPLSNGGGANTIVTLSWICGNAATGVSITIQDIFGITVRTFNVDFVMGAAMSRSVLIANGGTITASKTGGVWQNAVLTGIGIPI